MKFFQLFIVLPVYISALTENTELDYQGLSRRYIVHVPESVKQQVPLVVVLHGARGSAEVAAKHYHWVEKADREGFIAAFPEATPVGFPTNSHSWNDGLYPHGKDIDDLGFLRRVVEDVSHRFSVDPKRIYITGFSRGASMAFSAGIALSDIVAAVAPVSGHLTWKPPKAKRACSLLLITGDADPRNPLAGGKVKNPWNGRRENKPPMIESIFTWIKLLGLKRSDKQEKQEGDVITMRWGPNKEGREAVFIVVSGQGHEWPGGLRRFPPELSGGTVDFFHATDAIWDFFKGQKL